MSMHDGFTTDVKDLWALASRDALDRLTSLARRALRAPTALISTFDADRQYIESASYLSGTPAQGRFIPLPSSLCTHVLRGNMPMLVNAVRTHDALRLVPPDESAPIEAYIGVPIRDADGAAIGTLCVCDVTPRQWDADDVTLLEELAISCMAQIAAKVEALSRQRAQTALRDSEMRFTAVADTIPGLVFERRKVGPAQSRYTVFGAAKQNLPGVRDFMASGAESMAFLHPEDRERVQDEIRRSTGAETDLDMTFRLINADGTARWIRSQSVVRHDADGSAVWDGLCFDINDLVAAREAADAERLMKDTLLVDVNHELRTPLQAIIGFTDLLKNEARPDVVRTHALAIQNAGKALLSIVNQLLDLAGNEGTEPRSERAPTNIKLLAETCHDMIVPLVREKGIELRLIVDSDIPPLVLADGPKIQQVLVNLLNNAIKFTDAGSVTLHVARAESTLRFSVLDTGIGIAKDKIDFLFHRFSRIEPDSRAIRGTGLGLAITKKLVEGMGGTIGVGSNGEHGTTFWFNVPAETLEASEREPVRPQQSDHVPHDDTVVASGARILIADDLDLNRKLIADMLSVDGHETDCVSDGAAAVRAAGERRYDLILMDMIMPVMDGIAATRAIRALPAPACDVPIIALTAHSFKEQLDSCLAAGMDATLTKPMSLDVLNKTVRSWTTGRSKAA